MKNQSWSQKVAEMTKFGLAVVALVAAAGSSMAFANGHGYQGGETSGDAVPVQVSGGITVKAAVKAVTICALTGDPATGRLSLSDKIMRLAYGAVTLLPNQAIREGDVGANKDSRKIDMGVVLYYTGNRYLSLSKRDFNKADGSVEIQDGLDVSIPDPDDESAQVAFRTKEPFPVVQFEELVEKRLPDKWGHATDRGSLIKGISIKYGGNPSASMKLYPIDIGSSADVGDTPVPITVNAAEYVQCLQDELQKAAQK